MNPPALSRTRIAVGAAMVTATLATAGLAMSLAVAQDNKDASGSRAQETTTTTQNTPAAPVSRVTRTSGDDGERSTAKKTSTTTQTSTTTSGFTQAKPVQQATKPSQTRTKGS